MHGLPTTYGLCGHAGDAQRALMEVTYSFDALSVWSNANPPVIEGDYAIVDNFTDQGNVLSLTADGLVSITPTPAVRQSFDADHYSRIAKRFTADTKQYSGNVVPNGDTQNITLTVGVPFSSNVSSFFANPEGDPLAIAIVTGVPPDGTTIVNGVWSGTPILPGPGTFVLSASDGLDTGTCAVNWTVNPSPGAGTAGPLVAHTRVKTHIGGALIQ